MKERLFITLVFIGLLLCASSKSQTGDNSHSETWNIDNTNRIGEQNTTKLGGPVIIETDKGIAVEFDGVDDGLIVDANPLSDAIEFTIEVVFKPYLSSLAPNKEQRFIHMQESDNRRVLIELRLTNDDQWFLDTFIKGDASSKALYAENFPHPIGNWYHAALVYENGEMRHFVNGIEELSGEVRYLPMQTGKTSVGVRLNQRSWYKGAIRKLKVTHRALIPEEFMIMSTGIEMDGYNEIHLELNQNLPNRFNQSTMIRYSLPEKCKVTLVVFNLFGQQVAKPIDEIQPANKYWFTFE